MNDLFHRFYEWYIGWAGNVPDDNLIAIIRLTALFAAPTAIYYWAFISDNREGVGRLLAAVLADGLILAVPIMVPQDITARAWILTVCLMALASLPGVCPFFVFKEPRRQRRLTTGLYVLMGVLLLVGLLWS